ncbi:MAG: hypothetical protein EZS28_012234 [Streblomastix strix]|uniref:Uncharacterized protein n=1 Tax=Streblomastix strix TaxID=222440 RepID=A0A5J4WCF7_9EUKA|nr:MAG: hypothetical protein EZS28_012234 [Streblomastix strix]
MKVEIGSQVFVVDLLLNKIDSLGELYDITFATAVSVHRIDQVSRTDFDSIGVFGSEVVKRCQLRFGNGVVGEIKTVW